MSRLHDWPERLARYFRDAANTPFAWGTHDCVTFANGAHEAVTGVVVTLAPWASEGEAGAALGVLGGLESAVSTVLPSIPALTAQRGDVVLLGLGDRAWLAVCDGAIAFAPDAQGLRAAPMRLARAAWGVGRG